VTAQDWDKYKKEKMTVVLGDPNADEGVGEIVKGLLTPGETQSLGKKGSYLFTVKTDVFDKGQSIFIFSGENAFATREAHVRHREMMAKVPWEQIKPETIPISAIIKPIESPDMVPLKSVSVVVKPGEPISQISIPEMPVIIAPLKLMPATFSCSDLTISPAECKPGEKVTISARLTNVGEANGTHTVMLKIDGAIEDKKEVPLTGREATTISFIVSKDKPGTYNIQVNELSGRVRVLKPAQFTLTGLTITPQECPVGEEAFISFNLSNIGETKGIYTATLKINGEPKATKEITLDGGEITTVSFTTIQKSVGTYNVEVDGLSGDFILFKLRSYWPWDWLRDWLIKQR
jgi:hypothetical protein